MPLSTLSPTPPSTIRRPTMVRNATRSLVCTRAGTRATSPTNRLLMLLGLVQEANEVTPELLLVETHAKILYAQHTLRVDKRGEEGVVDIAVPFWRYEDAVAMRHIPDRCRRAGQESPAGQIG